MRILMTNYYLGGVTGSETFSYTVADELRRMGHDVELACKEWLQQGKGRDAVSGRVWNVGHLPPSLVPDVVHAHHNECARAVREQLPDVPMVYVCHSASEELERPPEGVEFHKVLGVSGEVVAWLHDFTDPEYLSMEPVGQPVDVGRFRPRAPVNPTIRRILVVSARMPQRRKRIMEEAAHYLRAAIRFVGGDGRWKSQGSLGQLYNWADVVVSMGRGVYEAMCCARVPVVFDKFGGDGMVTPENAEAMAWYNFSGRRFRHDWSLAELLTVLGQYDPENGRALLEWAWPRCAVGYVAGRLETEYMEAIDYGNTNG